MIDKILDFIAHIFSYFDKNEEKLDQFIPKDKLIIISPDGTWSLKDKNCFNNVTPQPPQIGDIMEPPNSFPNKKKLIEDLNKCYIKGVIDSCKHTLCENGNYLLRLNICPESSTPNNLKRLRKWMEKTYNFSTIQQDRNICTTTNEHYYIIVFEYNSKKLIFK